MNKLVIHHIYDNSAFDLSGNKNHGFRIAVTHGEAPQYTSWYWQNPLSEVHINRSVTLQKLWSIHVVVSFNLFIDGSISRRYNLMEGQLCFALFVERNGSLMGTILDRNGNWVGAQSVPNLVSTRQWHTAELLYDGINTVEICLDGVKVAAVYTWVYTWGNWDLAESRSDIGQTLART
jgi:hypothetical protein